MSIFDTLLGTIGAKEAQALATVGEPAPLFKAKAHDGSDFDLAAQKGKWTVLFFFPKAETPGCTKQACAFRDGIKDIRKHNAEVYGISSDDTAALAKFREHHRLNFTLLADPTLSIIKSYGAKMPVLSMSKRWTFIVDPQLKIRYVDQDVDPVKDPERVTSKLVELGAK